jgi:prepilin signal peptidase PulO-like enzyme (type II secretory pathway)
MHTNNFHDLLIFGTLCAGFFGLIIGSFLNVVILRLNTGRGVGGRSSCMTCGTHLKWYELIPVVSFLIQLGRCRHCGAKISWQYPLVEAGTGILFALTFLKLVPNAYIFQFLFMCLVWAVLVVITAYDVRHKIIPDGLVYLFIILGYLKIVTAIFFHAGAAGVGMNEAIMMFVAGPLLALPFYLLWLVSDGKWIGLGDAKLVLGFGSLLGLGLGISAVVLAFWIGAIISLLLIAMPKIGHMISGIADKKIGLKTEVPFAPFLILGFIIVYFTMIDVLGIHMLFHI